MTTFLTKSRNKLTASVDHLIRVKEETNRDLPCMLPCYERPFVFKLRTVVDCFLNLQLSDNELRDSKRVAITGIVLKHKKDRTNRFGACEQGTGNSVTKVVTKHSIKLETYPVSSPQNVPPPSPASAHKCNRSSPRLCAFSTIPP